MMTEELLERIKQKGRWPITFWDFFRYIFLSFPLGILLIASSALRSSIINDVPELKLVASIGLLISLFLTFFVSIRLYENQHFYCLNIPNLSKLQIDAALRKTKYKKTDYYKLGYYTCITSVSMFSWGEEITIIQDNNRLLINSRPKGNAFIFQSITIMKDRKNIKILIDELKKTATNIS